MRSLFSNKMRSGFYALWLASPALSVLFTSSDMAAASTGGLAWLGIAGLLLVNTAIVAIPVVFIKSQWAQRAAFMPLLTLALIALGYAWHNGASPGPAVLVSIYRTTPSEFAEVTPGLVRAYGPVLVLYFLLVWSVWRLPAKPSSPSRRTRLLVLNVAILLADGFMMTWAFWPQGFVRLVPPGAEETVFPANLAIAAYNALQTDVHDHLSAQQKQFRFGAFAREPAAPLRVILVIGESSSAERWQLGGYRRPTNPRLTTLTEGKLLFFPDVLAAGTSTRSTVPIILTRATPNEFSRAMQERSIISAFSEARYSTSWISNQDRFPYSDEADSEAYINPDWSVRGRYDEDLLPLVARQIKSHERLFLVVHTLGSHVQYRYRVPEADRYFGKREGATILDDYDDTIRYSDRLLADLIDLLAQNDTVPSVLLYVSDHGQDLTRAAAGEVSQGLSAFPLSLVHIPLAIWMSPRYVSMAPAVELDLEQNRLCPHSQIEIFHTLKNLGRIDLPDGGPSLFDHTCGRPRPISIGARVQQYP